MEERLSKVSEALVPATRTASLLPSSTDLDFYCSIDPDVKRALERISTDLQDVVNFMTTWMGEEAGNSTLDHLSAPTSFAGSVGDTVDRLLERADIYLDEYTGVRKIAPSREKKSSQETSSTGADESDMMIPSTGKLPPHLQRADIPKPQDKFSRQPDNRANTPWERTFQFGKPNARVPIGWRDPSWNVSSDAIIEGQYGTEGDPRLGPYYVEIQQTPVPESAFHVGNAEAPVPLRIENPGSSQPCDFVWVDSAEKVRQLQKHLEEERVTEIAVDLEHHNQRSYQGIVCLMQISTRWGDWIVDTLVDEVRESAELLNTAFTHPDKVLVLHGADHDILWLQRDLGLYVTNLFDTFQAARALQFGALSLAFLLLRYTNFEADKRFQTADWRIRPLPREMLFYARSDTHALLYVYDCLRNELLQRGGPLAVKEVFDRSKPTASKVYAKEPWDERGNSRGGWKSLWIRMGGDLARASQDAPPDAPLGREERIVRRLHHWRDQVARKEDESPAFVMPPRVLIQLALRPPLNLSEAKARTPPSLKFVRSRLDELVKTVKDEWHAYLSDVRPESLGDESTVDKLGEPLSSSKTEAEEDLGEKWTPTSTIPQEASSMAVAQEVPMHPDVWARQPQGKSSPDAQLFRGVKVLDEPEKPKKSKSLFEMPSARAPAQVSRTLQNIRTDLVQRLGTLVGAAWGRPAAELQPEDNHDQPKEDTHPIIDNPEEERASKVATTAVKRAFSQDRQDSDEEARAAEGAARQTEEHDVGTDPVVQVRKHSGPTRKRQRAKSTPNSGIPVAFDYGSASSMLEAPRPHAQASLLPTSTSGARKVAEPKGARQKSNVRHGNKSGTFATRRS